MEVSRGGDVHSKAEFSKIYPKKFHQSDYFLFFLRQVRFCGSKSIYVVVFATAVKYTLGNEVNETYKMKFASS